MAAGALARSATLVLLLTLAACGGDDGIDDGLTTPYTSTPYSANGGAPDRVESQLADWSKLFEGEFTDHLTPAEAKTVLGLDAEPEFQAAEFGSSKYRWRGADRSKRYVSLYVLPPVNNENTFLNAQGYKRQAEHGMFEEVDLGQPGVWAFWRVQSRKTSLIVFTKTHILEIGTSGMPPEEGETLATAVARHLFESNS